MRSGQSAGVGAAPGPARPRTTCTSRPRVIRCRPRGTGRLMPRSRGSAVRSGVSGPRVTSHSPRSTISWHQPTLLSCKRASASAQRLGFRFAFSSPWAVGATERPSPPGGTASISPRQRPWKQVLCDRPLRLQDVVDARPSRQLPRVASPRESHDHDHTTTSSSIHELSDQEVARPVSPVVRLLLIVVG
jgi:hypothetical protein